MNKIFKRAIKLSRQRDEFFMQNRRPREDLLPINIPNKDSQKIVEKNTEIKRKNTSSPVKRNTIK